MADYQTLQTAYIIREVLAAEGMNALAIISSYLVVAYFVGPKLSRFQLWAISILYTVFCLGPLDGFYIAALDLKSLNQGEQGSRTLELPLAVEYPWMIPAIIVLGWIMSIVFMINARRSSQSQDLEN
jgi:hypothetical protein